VRQERSTYGLRPASVTVPFFKFWTAYVLREWKMSASWSNSAESLPPVTWWQH